MDELSTRVLVIYDGDCGFCSRAVRWLLRRDRHDRLRFVPATSSCAAGFIARSGLAVPSGSRPGSILAVRAAETPRESIASRSNAIRVILRELPPPWPLAALVLGCVPRPLRDFAYQAVARLRHRLAAPGCPLPTAGERGKFL